MKKNLLIGLAALAAVTITSCQKDQVINQVPQEQAIEFGTYVGRDAQTKGSVTDISTLCGAANDTKGFGVFAYYTGTSDYTSTLTPNFMYNQRVYGTASGAQDPTYTWSYSPIKYWPNNTGDKISFFAYAPYNHNNSNYSISASNTQGDPTISYNVSDDLTNHVDLLYAVPHENVTKQDIDEEINFHFYHALSRIGFKVEAMVDNKNGDNTGESDDDTTTPNGSINAPASQDATGTTITLKELSLSGKFYPSGTLNLATSSTPTSPASSAPIWNSTTPNAIKTFTILNNQDTDDITVTTAKTTIKEDEFLMIIPQNFAEVLDPASDEEVTIKVIYDVTTTDSSNSANSSTITNTITESFNFNFEAGKAYSFNLHIGLTSVKFTANVEDWDESDVAVNVPINTTQP
ncbi:MAG: fimbrillin family protein, partial [Bacteroidales bacterium]|nr:fimbrillin family protein [Bacteroidales bacterium]